ncbi:MAG TPA: ABC transporter permease [Acidimicrobiales bacterium]
MGELGRKARLYVLLVRARVRADWQYRTPFVLFTVAQFGITFLDFLLIAVIFQRTPHLEGWSLPEVAFLYGTSGVSFFIGDVFISQVERVGMYVKDGRFDSLLVRPMGTLFQLSTEEFAFRRFGKLVQSTIVLVVATASLDVAWTPGRAGMVALMLTTGAVIFSAIWVAGSAITFFAVDSIEVVNSFTYGGNYATQYPIGVFGPWLRRFITLAVPTAFVNYFPALYVLGRSDTLGLPSWSRFASPGVAVVTVLVAMTAWRVGLRHYRSTGS